MARSEWVVVDSTMCPALQKEAHLLERHVYPGDVLFDLQRPRINRRKCSLDLECNLAGISCRWAYTNPDNDPFSRV